jgi:deoxyribodipyrimidine photolyase
MNERIFELAEQAKDKVPAGLVVSEWIDAYNRLFAELIIQECVTTMREHGNTYAYPTAGEYQAGEFAQAIQKHFGVNEC